MDAEKPGEYRRTAAKMDSCFLGHDNWLTEYGIILPLCIGGISEGSDEVQNLIDTLTTAMLKKVGLTRGHLALTRGAGNYNRPLKWVLSLIVS